MKTFLLELRDYGYEGVLIFVGGSIDELKAQFKTMTDEIYNTLKDHPWVLASKKDYRTNATSEIWQRRRELVADMQTKRGEIIAKYGLLGQLEDNTGITHHPGSTWFADELVIVPKDDPILCGWYVETVFESDLEPGLQYLKLVYVE